MEDYLTLLREALDLLINIHKSCDPSVADYVLQIEVAVRFIHKALMTEDRLDIFKALQKAYDVLEKENYDDQPENEDYNDLVERIEKALEGLQQQQQEGIILNKSTLKALTKMVLDEIFLPPSKAELEKQASLQVFHQSIERNKPAYLKTTKEGHKQAYRVLGNMVKNMKEMVAVSLKKDEKKFDKLKKQLGYNSEWLISFMVQWSNQIHDKDMSKFNAVDKIMNEFREHFNTMSVVGNNMFDSIRTYQNYINASKESERVNENFAGMKKTIDDLFQIGLDIGFGKEQMVGGEKQKIVRKKGEIVWPDTPFTMDTLVAQNPHIRKDILRKKLTIALKTKVIFIKGMMMSVGGQAKPILIFMKRQQ
jgi:hypothetical protein